MFKVRAFRQCVGVVVEGFEQMKKKRLGFAFLVAFEFGGEVGEFLKPSFL
jgi:hypothetical protein